MRFSFFVLTHLATHAISKSSAHRGDSRRANGIRLFATRLSVAAPFAKKSLEVRPIVASSVPFVVRIRSGLPEKGQGKKTSSYWDSVRQAFFSRPAIIIFHHARLIGAKCWHPPKHRMCSERIL